MSESGYVRRNWKRLLNIVTIVVLIALVVTVWDQIGETFHNLFKVRGWVLLLLIPIEAMNYHAQTRLYQKLFAITGEYLNYKYLYKLALELNYVNNVYPSAGVSGISFFGLRLKADGVSGSKATLVQLMKLVLTFLSFEVLLLLGMLILAAVGKASNMIVLIGTLVTTLIIVGTVVAAYIIGDRKRVQTFFVFATRALNKLLRIVRPKDPETIKLDKLRHGVDDLHDNYTMFKRNMRALRAPLAYGVLANATEVLAIYVVYVAFDQWVNLGAVILAYAVANFAGLVSVLPGGAGIYEGLMTLVLAAGGIKPALSLPVTVMYRILNMALQLIPGGYLYHKNLHGRPAESSAIHEKENAD